MKLTERTLGEICDEVGGIIRTGPFGSQLHQADYLEDGIPVVMPKDIVGEKLSVESIARIGMKDVARLSQHILMVGDIVYGRRGDIGRQALITKKESGWICGTGCLRISLNDTVLDPNFLHYYLMQEDVIEWIYKQAVGATMPNLNTSILRSVPIQYPSLETQRKIVSILSAYDDLIENNTRRIKILEEMARMIYREWFVNFRFPGHEQVKMVDSPLGLIPEGWDIGRLDDALVLQRGFDLPKQDRVEDGDVPVYAATGQNGRHNEAKVKGPCVITGRSGSLGTVIYVDEDFWPLNTTLWVKEFKKATPTFAYYLLSEMGLAQYNAGVAVPTLNRNDVHGLQVILPPRKLLDVFESLATAIFKFKKTLETKNQNLRQTRDLLLPKLISGEVGIME